MVNLVRIALDMMNSFERYCSSMDKKIASKDYYRLCLDSRYLLESLGEEVTDDLEMRVNSSEMKKGIHALKEMSRQLDEDVIDEDLVRCSYSKFKENSKKFMKELFECYVNNEFDWC